MIEAPEPPHHHHHKTGVPWFDLIMPLAVLAISVASLLTSLQSEKSMHALVEQNERLVSAQSTPILMLDSGNFLNGKREITIDLTNVGTGPAQIVWFHLKDDQGNEYANGGFFNRLSKTSPQSAVGSEKISGSFIRTAATRAVLTWPRPADGASDLAEWNSLDTHRFDLHGKACYCSIFNECHVTDFSNAPPTPISSCDASAAKP